MRKFGLIAAIVGFGILGADLLLRLLTNFSSWLWLPGFIAFAGGGAAILWSRWSSATAVVPAPKASQVVGADTARLLDNFEQRFAELKGRKPSGTVLGDLYTLGTQLELRGRTVQATAVFRHLARIDNTYKDVSTRLKRLMDTDRAKSKAEGMFCLNNTKQITLAWHIYSGDFNDNVANNYGVQSTLDCINNKHLDNWVNNVMTWDAAGGYGSEAAMDPRDAANRDLLIGLLALQNGLVDQDVLVAAGSYRPVPKEQWPKQ